MHHQKQRHRHDNDESDDEYELLVIGKQYVPSDRWPSTEGHGVELNMRDLQLVMHLKAKHMFDAFGNTIEYSKPKPLLVLCLEALKI